MGAVNGLRSAPTNLFAPFRAGGDA